MFLWKVYSRGLYFLPHVCTQPFVYTICSTTIYRKLSFLHGIVFALLLKIGLYVSVSGHSILFHWSTCLFSCHYHTMLIIVVYSKPVNQVVSVLEVCPSSSVLCYLVLFNWVFAFLYKIENQFANIQKITCWDFDWVYWFYRSA